uniref:Cilia and flagella associated protein 119 n=1 Tax=Maylandia zebra TaxID=106582 RepID=A0A3P9BYJ5_9CICH
ITYPVNKHGSHSSRTDSPQSFSLLGLLCIALDSVNDTPPPPPPPKKNPPKHKHKQKTKKQNALCSVLRVDLPEPRKGVLLELYVQTVLFCREHSFNKEQTSTLLSIIKSIHEANVETPLNNSEQCFKYCRELLLCHSVRRPPFSISLFNADEVNRVLTYILNNYMKHYKLYKYIFTTQVNLCCRHNFYSPTQPKQSHARNGFISSLSGATSELKALIEQQVREQMMLVSGQLDQRIKEKASQQNSALDYSQNSHKAKK